MHMHMHMHMDMDMDMDMNMDMCLLVQCRGAQRLPLTLLFTQT